MFGFFFLLIFGIGVLISMAKNQLKPKHRKLSDMTLNEIKEMNKNMKK